jgi:protease-4
MRRLIAVLIAVLVIGMILASLMSSGPAVEDGSVVIVDLAGTLEEAPAIDVLDQLTADGPALPTLLLALEMAAADERIRGVILHVREVGAGYARIQELRDAIGRLRDQDKSVIALLDLESFNATREYYLASAADKIFIDRGSLGPLAGIAGQYVHLGNLLERLGIDVEFARVGQYKSAVEMFAEPEMSEPARQMATAIIDGVYSQIVDGIAEGRGLSRARVEALIDQAPGTALEYVSSKLADGVAGTHEVFEAAGFKDAPRIKLADYARTDPRSLGLRKGPKIALVFGDGAISRTGAGLSRGFSTDDVARALEDAGEDESIEAVVLRINCGGGSALASEQIWRTVRKLREEKPVIVSMADAAASGGYYIASGADAILAQPATLTGSIGVFVLRPSIAALYEKLDVGVEVITRGQHAGIGGSDQPLSPVQYERTQSLVQSAYRDFLSRVAEGRETEPAEIDRLGQGYVWLGDAALERGLIDELGGLFEAVQVAKERAGIDPDVDPVRVVFPGPRSLGQQFQDMLRSELPARLRRSLLPIELPEILQWAWIAREGRVSYLPAHWVHVY